MAMLLFKGETLTVRVTHNVLSEMIRLNKSTYVETLSLSNVDPMGWMRDILYCSLLIYNPIVLKKEDDSRMNRYDVGDELYELDAEVTKQFMTDLLSDFVKTISKGTKKVASEKE